VLYFFIPNRLQPVSDPLFLIFQQTGSPHVCPQSRANEYTVLAMTLFQAQPYDPRPARRKRDLILALIVLVIVIGLVWWQFRFWPEEHRVDRFFDALQQQNFEPAYGIWMHDPDWKQHPDKYSQYPYNDFIKDWGPSGEWGIIKSHHVDGTKSPPASYGGSPFAPVSGVVVQVTVNDRVADKAHIWVQKDDKTLSFSPY
jgi:hypothetical protein